MSEADQFAAFNTWLAAHPGPSDPPTPGDYAADGSEAADEAMLPVGRGEEQRLQQAYDNYLERETA